MFGGLPYSWFALAKFHNLHIVDLELLLCYFQIISSCFSSVIRQVRIEGLKWLIHLIRGKTREFRFGRLRWYRQKLLLRCNILQGYPCIILEYITSGRFSDWL